MPLYSGCSLKFLVIMSLSAAFAACSSLGSRTSHVAKLFLQKYWHDMPAFLSSSSNISLLSPTSLLVFRSETTREDSWCYFFNDLRDGQYLIAFKVFSVSAHPVLFIIFRSSLLALPGCGAFLGRLYRAFLTGVLCVCGDRQRRPICPY